jgi:hypothetical protein
MSKISLHQIATARSGDKGNHANIGVVARDAAAYKILARELTAERVGNFFAGLGATKVERFELPNVGAFNFLLYDALAGGASQSLRSDTQGKLLGSAILDMSLPIRSAEITTEDTESAEEDWNE